MYLRDETKVNLLTGIKNESSKERIKEFYKIKHWSESVKNKSKKLQIFFSATD